MENNKNIQGFVIQFIVLYMLARCWSSFEIIKGNIACTYCSLEPQKAVSGLLRDEEKPL